MGQYIVRLDNKTAGSILKHLSLFLEKTTNAPMKTPFADMNLVRLSAQQGALNLDNEFILIDNFNTVSQPDNASDLFVNHPVKLACHVVTFCLSGTIRFRINLQYFEVKTNDVLICQEGIIGEFLGMDPGTRIAVIATSKEFYTTPRNFETAISLHHQLHVYPLCHMNPEVINECMTIYQLMRNKIAETKNRFRKVSLLGYVQVMTYTIFNYCLDADNAMDAPKETANRQYELYARFFREVQKHYTQERSIAYYANLLCVTPKYLSQVVRRVSGRLAGEWISDYVILEAKALLKSREYTIQQISNMLNFANQSFFGKYFKDKVGCSPSAYQNAE